MVATLCCCAVWSYGKVSSMGQNMHDLQIGVAEVVFVSEYAGDPGPASLIVGLALPQNLGSVECASYNVN